MLRHLKLLFFNLFQHTLEILPPKITCLLNNARQTVKGRKIKFFYEKDKKLFKHYYDELKTLSKTIGKINNESI